MKGDPPSMPLMPVIRTPGFFSVSERSNSDMFTGAYLFASGAIFLIGLAVLAYSNSRGSGGGGKRKYAFTSLILVGFILVLFISLSILAGLMSFGGPQDWSYPKDYLSYGTVGWILMLLPLLGILAPLLVSLVMAHRSKSQP
jgi:hypothetical protein